jgi:DNA polymerase III delta prime subunit
MLRKKLKQMIEQHGKTKTKKLINEELAKLNEKMRSATNIYQAIDIEHDILDQKAMLKWLKKNV